MADYTQFQINVATALARWQVIERNLQQVFIDAIETREPAWAAVVYHTIVSFKGKLDMLNEILLYRFENSNVLRKWKPLKTKIETLSIQRNNLVHWMFVGSYHEGMPDYVYTAIPAIGDVRKKVRGKKITEDDLVAMIDDFGEFQHRITEFHHLMKQEISLQLSLQPQPHEFQDSETLKH